MTRWLIRALAAVSISTLGAVVAATPSQAAANAGVSGVGLSCSSLPTNGFVLGNLTAAAAASPGATVEFWGAQWAKDNVLSGGSAPDAFKGYADTVTGSGSAGTWTTAPGNSSDPPASIKNPITVIVARSITQSGSLISGDVYGLAKVIPSSGYGPDPGHAGTGTITGAITSCAS